jgi:hypothetical protein
MSPAPRVTPPQGDHIPDRQFTRRTPGFGDRRQTGVRSITFDGAPKMADILRWSVAKRPRSKVIDLTPV